MIEIDLDIDLNRIDTKEAILESLKDLASFHEIINLRRKAGYKHHLRMKEWYINGIWYLDSCGNLGQAEDGEMFDSPQPVISRDEYIDLNIKNGTMFSMSDEIAPAHAICNICRECWTIDNAHDFRVIQSSSIMNLDAHVGMILKDLISILRECDFGWRRISMDIRNEKYIDIKSSKDNVSSINHSGWKRDVEDNYVIQEGDEIRVYNFTYQHKQCYMLDEANKEVKLFKELFNKVNIPCFLKTIPNEYSNAFYYCPWFEVWTPWGKMKIGWRKRVIQIECEYIQFEEMFPDENVTKSKNYIHAWGWDKAEEYLKKIRPLLIAKGKKL